MNMKKLQARENRLNQAKAKVAARQKMLQDQGRDEKAIQKDSVMRKLRADVRKIHRSIASIQANAPKAEKDEKAGKKGADSKPPKKKKAKKEKADAGD